MKILKYWYLWILDIVLAVIATRWVIANYAITDFIAQLGVFMISLILIYGIVRTITKIFKGGWWIEVDRAEVPRWVRKASDRFYDRCKVRPYNKVIYLKGKHRRYKVWYEMIGQGQVSEHYYYKKR